MRAFRPLVLVLALVTAAPVSAQFSDSTDVTAVQIPVQVVADGKAVRLRQGQETPVALVSYHLAGDLKIRTQVTTPDGREVSTGGLRVLGRESGATDGAQRLRAAFLTPPLAPGEYLLRVTVSGEGGERTSSAPFVVN